MRCCGDAENSAMKSESCVHNNSNIPALNMNANKKGGGGGVGRGGLLL